MRSAQRTSWALLGLMGLLATAGSPVAAQSPAGETAVVTLPPILQQGRDLLKTQRYAEARALYTRYLATHPNAPQAEVGLGDAAVRLHQWEAAEEAYRTAVAKEPQLWQAHKDLVLVEAKLGRWEEFDRERTVLAMARQRHAPGITAEESDLIDSFDASGGHWVVRAYPEPVGRSQTLYNFERFSPAGRVEAYLSLEGEAAARAALHPRDVRIGAPSLNAAGGAATPLALNWYTGEAHGAIQRYPAGMPSYEQLRADVVRWLKTHPEKSGSGTTGTSAAHRTP